MKDYKKILEGIVNIISTTEKSDIVSNICSYIDENCPELKESEDEKIRKTLIELVKCNERSGYTSFNGVSTGSLLAWLEKHGNNKPDFRERYKKMTESEWFKKTYEDKSCGIDTVDEAERKFHEGDWIVENDTNKVVQIARYEERSDGTLVWFNNGTGTYIEYLHHYHLWTIEDAKDGDVLSSYECYVIFKEIDGLNIKCYFTYHLNIGSIPTFYVNTLQNKTAFSPVTKEEREIFLKKVNEFGYGWDCENKKLFKI